MGKLLNFLGPWSPVGPLISGAILGAICALAFWFFFEVRTWI